MTEQERRERQRRNREKRKKELMKHMAMGICAIIVIIAVVAAVFVPKRGQNEEALTSSVTAQAKDSASGKNPGESDDSAFAASSDLSSEQSTENSVTEISESSRTDITSSSEISVPADIPVITETPVPTDEIAPATTAAPTETPVPEETPSPEPADDPAANTGYYNTYVSDIDRSTFAVDPSVPCGSDWYPEDEKVVYLTLDDGPSYLTEQFLDVLDRYNVKATFFVTGQNPDYFYLIKEAYDRGHTIGLHTYTHDYSSVYASVDDFFNEIYAIGNVVQQQIGYIPCFIRFPGGSTNTISDNYCPGIMDVLRYEVQARGFQYYDWNCSSGDGGSNTNVAELAAQGASSPYPTTILLSHDGNLKEATLLALPAIIEFYLSYGYEFRPLDRTTFTAHQS